MTIASGITDDTQFPSDVRIISGGDGTSLNRGDHLTGKIGTILGALNEPLEDLILRTNFLRTAVDPLINPVHRKSELYWSGINIAISTTPVNIIQALKGFVQTSGQLAPFFDNADNKMHVFNENRILTFKLVLIGSFSGGSSPRQVSLSFTGAVPDIIAAHRTDIVTPDYLTFPTFFSVDENGFLATNGSILNVVCSSGTFTATGAKLIAEQ